MNHYLLDVYPKSLHVLKKDRPNRSRPQSDVHAFLFSPAGEQSEERWDQAGCLYITMG